MIVTNVEEPISSWDDDDDEDESTPKATTQKKSDDTEKQLKGTMVKQKLILWRISIIARCRSEIVVRR